MGIVSQHAVHVVTALAGCRKPLVRGPSLLFTTNKHKNYSSAFVGVPFLAL